MNGVNLLEPLNGSAQQTVGLCAYVKSAFPVFLSAAIALAVVMITWGGIEYMLSKIPGAKIEGKDRIKNAIWGLLIALAAWIIIQTINPAINTSGFFNC